METDCCYGPVVYHAHQDLVTEHSCRAGHSDQAVTVNSTKGSPACSRARAALFSNFITVLPKPPKPASGQSCFSPHLPTFYCSVAVSQPPPRVSACLPNELMNKEAMIPKLEAMNWAQQ